MKLPDVTPAQLLALVTLAAGQAVAWGWIGKGTSALLVSITTAVLAAVWHIADAVIRHGRSRALAPPPVPPTPGG